MNIDTLFKKVSLQGDPIMDFNTTHTVREEKNGYGIF